MFNYYLIFVVGFSLLINGEKCPPNSSIKLPIGYTPAQGANKFPFAEAGLQLFTDITIPCDGGFISQWRFIAPNTYIVGLHLGVFRRRLNPLLIDLVGETYIEELRVPDAHIGRWVKFSPHSPLAVQQGDMIGIFYDRLSTPTEFLTIMSNNCDFDSEKRNTYVFLRDQNNFYQSPNKTVMLDANEAVYECRRPALMAVVVDELRKNTTTTPRTITKATTIPSASPNKYLFTKPPSKKTTGKIRPATKKLMLHKFTRKPSTTTTLRPIKNLTAIQVKMTTTATLTMANLNSKKTNNLSMSKKGKPSKKPGHVHFVKRTPKPHKMTTPKNKPMISFQPATKLAKTTTEKSTFEVITPVPGSTTTRTMHKVVITPKPSKKASPSPPPPPPGPPIYDNSHDNSHVLALYQKLQYQTTKNMSKSKPAINLAMAASPVPETTTPEPIWMPPFMAGGSNNNFNNKFDLFKPSKPFPQEVVAVYEVTYEVAQKTSKKPSHGYLMTTTPTTTTTQMTFPMPPDMIEEMKQKQSRYQQSKDPGFTLPNVIAEVGSVPKRCFNVPSMLQYCHRETIRAYFDYRSGTCTHFYGCEPAGNNANNFPHLNDCIYACEQHTNRFQTVYGSLEEAIKITTTSTTTPSMPRTIFLAPEPFKNIFYHSILSPQGVIPPNYGLKPINPLDVLAYNKFGKETGLSSNYGLNPLDIFGSNLAPSYGMESALDVRDLNMASPTINNYGSLFGNNPFLNSFSEKSYLTRPPYWSYMDGKKKKSNDKELKPYL